MPRDTRDRVQLLAETLDNTDETHERVRRVPWLTILHHPVPSRIGEEASLEILERAGSSIVLSRTEPDFVSPLGSKPWPLADPFLSRTPLRIKNIAGTHLEIAADAESFPINIQGRAIQGAQLFVISALEPGLVIELGKR